MALTDAMALSEYERACYLACKSALAANREVVPQHVHVLVAAIERMELHRPPLIAEGAGPLLDPDCRDGKCASCVGPPCEHECHQAT